MSVASGQLWPELARLVWSSSSALEMLELELASSRWGSAGKGGPVRWVGPTRARASAWACELDESGTRRWGHPQRESNTLKRRANKPRFPRRIRMLPEGDRGNWQYESYCWSGTGLVPGTKKPPNHEGSRAIWPGASAAGGVNGRFSREVAIPRNSLPVRSPTASAKGARGVWVRPARVCWRCKDRVDEALNRHSFDALESCQHARSWSIVQLSIGIVRGRLCLFLRNWPACKRVVDCSNQDSWQRVVDCAVEHTARHEGRAKRVDEGDRVRS